MPSLPKYQDFLNVEDRKKYNEKLKITLGIDPYNVNSKFFSDLMDLWPEVEFPDIVTYLLFSKSPYTKEQLKAYKSLEAYQYFVDGFVSCIFVGKVSSNIKVLIAKTLKCKSCGKLDVSFLG